LQRLFGLQRQDLRDRAPVLEQRCVEKSDQRRDRPEDSQHLGVKAIRGRERRFEFAAGKKLFES
jgi:hypothetical protein